MVFLYWNNFLIDYHINALRQRKKYQYFAFKGIFLNENVWIAIKIPLKFVLKGSINSESALVQVMAWHQTGNKPLSETIMV